MHIAKLPSSLWSKYHFLREVKVKKFRMQRSNMTIPTSGTKYSRIDQVKFVEDSL